MDEYWLEINHALHRKDTTAALGLIPRYLRFHRHSPEAIYQASEFYRKSGDLVRALRILPKEATHALSPRASDIETKLQVQLVRILNSLGASEYALRVIQRLRESAQVKSKIEILGVYISNYKYAEALDLLSRTDSTPDVEPWHQDWLLHFYRADALCGLGQWDEAIKIVKKIRETSASPLIQAIAWSAAGEYLTQAGETKKALRPFLEAQKFFQEDPPTIDNGIFRKWLGICYLRLGRLHDAEQELTAANKIFFQPGRKPEPWLESLLWLDQIRIKQGRAPAIGPRAYAILGPNGSLIENMGKMGIKLECDENTIFSIDQIGIKRKGTHFDRASDLAWRGKHVRVGADLVDDLVCNLIYAGELGLPQFRLYEILWPEDVFSFSQQQRRMEQIVHRARNQGFKIVWRDLHLRLTSNNITATSRPRQVVRGYGYLKEHQSFTRREVQRYFALSRTSAIVLCRYWLKENLVQVDERLNYKSLVYSK